MYRIYYARVLHTAIAKGNCFKNGVNSTKKERNSMNEKFLDLEKNLLVEVKNIGKSGKVELKQLTKLLGDKYYKGNSPTIKTLSKLLDKKHYFVLNGYILDEAEGKKVIKEALKDGCLDSEDLALKTYTSVLKVNFCEDTIKGGVYPIYITFKEEDIEEEKFAKIKSNEKALLKKIVQKKIAEKFADFLYKNYRELIGFMALGYKSESIMIHILNDVAYEEFKKQIEHYLLYEGFRKKYFGNKKHFKVILKKYLDSKGNTLLT